MTREHAELFSEHRAARSVFCKNSLLIGLCYLLFTQTSSLDIQVFSRERENKHSSDTQSSSFHIWRTLLKGQSTPVMQWYHQLYNHTILAKEGGDVIEHTIIPFLLGKRVKINNLWTGQCKIYNAPPFARWRSGHFLFLISKLKVMHLKMVLSGSSWSEVYVFAECTVIHQRLLL